jgi:hypothetical protein
MATVPFRLVFSYSFIYRTNHAQSNASSAASPPLDGTSGEATHAASVPCLDWSTGRFPGAGDEAHNFTPRNTSSAAARLKPSPCLPHPPQNREPPTSLRRPFTPPGSGSHDLELSPPDVSPFSTIRTTCHWWRSKARSFTWFSLPSNNTMRSGSGCLRVTRRVAPSGRQGTDIVVRLWEGRPPVRNIARSFISLRLLCSALSGIVQTHSMLVSDKICITETWVRDLDAWWLYLVIGWVVAHCFSWAESRRLAIY